MKFWQISISRRSLTIAAVLVTTVSLGLGAHAALNKRALDAAKAIASEQGEDGVAKGYKSGSKIALVIGNGHYPDANAPLAQPINDARALTARLRTNGFDVDVVEDASKDDMRRAVARLQAKVKPDSVVMLYFGGYGVQARRESYMIPVDAKIWKDRYPAMKVITPAGAREKVEKAVPVDSTRADFDDADVALVTVP